VAQARTYPLAKNVEDKILALALIVLLAPFFALGSGAMALGMLRRRADRGPWLYRERRISRGREFNLLKLRTLRADVLSQMPDHAHARQLEADRANLTWAGRRVLKPWYLDELPQLFNVLKGDMSLVGPRPWPLPMVADQLARGFTYRNEVMAGWTGLAQVRKGITPSAGYAELDLAYIDDLRTARAARVVWRDIGILWETAKVIARGEGLRF
jgi:lipopolysaccharide/colanic/teichoic acid biosynthesis glycosyltransferase